MNRKEKSFNSTENNIHNKLTFLVLLLGLTCTAATSYWIESKDKAYALLKFIDQCQTIEQKITTRLRTQEQYLLSSAAMFEASNGVTRQEFQIYANRLLHNQHFNGIQALGFSQ